MKTASNSRPLAECTVISWIASCAGLRLVVAGFERGVGQEGRQRRHDLAGLGVGQSTRIGGRRAPACSSTGSATASLPKPSCVTKASAALTSSSRFSMRSWPSFSVR